MMFIELLEILVFFGAFAAVMLLVRFIRKYIISEKNEITEAEKIFDIYKSNGFDAALKYSDDIERIKAKKVFKDFEIETKQNIVNAITHDSRFYFDHEDRHLMQLFADKHGFEIKWSGFGRGYICLD